MIARAVEAPGSMPSREVLSALLARSAAGDTEAFAEFYDATCHVAYRWARCSLGDVATAEQAVLQLYVAAWQRAGQHHASGLSPLAWLLALPASAASDTAA